MVGWLVGWLIGGLVGELVGELLSSIRYDTVIRACGLRDDLKVLPGGDMTEIGDRGINLRCNLVTLAIHLLAYVFLFVFTFVFVVVLLSCCQRRSKAARSALQSGICAYEVRRAGRPPQRCRTYR